MKNKFYFFFILLELILLMLFSSCGNSTGDDESNNYIVLDKLNNLGGTDLDYFHSVIESGDYYIAAGWSPSDLSTLPGGSNTTGSYDFVIAKFNKSDLSLVGVNNLGGRGDDCFYSVIESGDYYIAVGSFYSNLSGFPGGRRHQDGSIL